MNFYDFKEISEAGDCVRFAEEILGCTVKNGRCAAKWRGGTRDDSVSITKEQWNDFADGKGGGLTELCAVAKFNGDTMAAQEYLGQWLNLTPKQLSKRPKDVTPFRNRYDSLIADGYKKTARYSYTDAQGEEQYFVVRLEHETKHKQFLQGTKDGWGIKGIAPLLYHLPEVIAADCVFIVEGEKDVETLRSLGLTATTNSSGASKWHDEFNDVFKGKRVIIIADNDEAGQKHGLTVANALYGKASTIQLLTVSKLPKGDVTDFITKEGGTIDALYQMIGSTPQFDPADPVAVAKELNKTAFANVIYEETERGGVKETPRDTNIMLAELHQRMIGQPYITGETLFSYEAGTGAIYYIYDSASLFAWIAQKTAHPVMWSRTQGAATKPEFFESVRATAKRYSAIQYAPEYPGRKDVFYTHPTLPEPDAEHRYFWGFVDFFKPADEVNRSMLAAFIMAPMYYDPRTSRPLWIIDSIDGRGSGKSKLAEIVAQLYGKDSTDGSPIGMEFADFRKNDADVIKRIISPEAGCKRILLIDNATGKVHCDLLASMATAKVISGRAAYGRGEVSRPNNLTYVITSNNAAVDADIASRAYYVMLQKPTMSPDWNTAVQRYIEEHRLAIYADILDMIGKHRPFNVAPVTRNPEFEQKVLQAACQTEVQYNAVIGFLQDQKEVINVEIEDAEYARDWLFQHIASTPAATGLEPLKPLTDRNLFVRSDVIDKWNRDDGKREYSVERLRDYATQGYITQIEKRNNAFPNKPNGLFKRRRGIMLNRDTSTRDCRVIALINGEAREILQD